MSATAPRLPFERPDPCAPPPEYARLRETCPVARISTPDGHPAWLVTSYEAAAAVLMDPRVSMNPPGPVESANNTLFQDGEPHARLRRLVARAFTSRNVTALQPRIERSAAEFAANLAAAGPPTDLVAGFAAPLSITTISEILGITIEDRDRFRCLADTLTGLDFTADEETALQARCAWSELGGFIATLVEKKRTHLGDDLLSAMIAVSDVQDGRLDDGELTAMASALITAGYATTRNAICAGAMRLSAENRLASLADDPDALSATVEEVLRHQSGQIGSPMPRWAHDEVALAGATISPGDQVLVRTEAANRDPAVYTEPDSFDVDRVGKPHMAFGRGPHHCLGAALARVELAASFQALSRYLPNLRLLGSEADIAWTRGVDVGLDRLDVTW